MGLESSCCRATNETLENQSEIEQVCLPMRRDSSENILPYHIAYKREPLIKLQKVQCDWDLPTAQFSHTPNIINIKMFSDNPGVSFTNNIMPFNNHDVIVSQTILPSQHLQDSSSRYIELRNGNQSNSTYHLRNSYTKPAENSLSDTNLYLNLGSTMDSFPNKSLNQPNNSQTNFLSSLDQEKFHLLNNSQLQSSSSQTRLNNKGDVQEFFSDGSSYLGKKMDGKKHGQGIFYFPNQSHYEGEWENDMMSGNGLLFYPGGQLAYQGQFKDNKFNGVGQLFNQEVEYPNGQESTQYFINFNLVGQKWTKYQGEFMNDKKNGNGKLYFSNGDIINANFSHDLIQGEGIVLRQDKVFLHGIWKDNILHSQYCK